MDPITEIQLRATIEQHGIQRFLLRRCSMCEAPLYYMIEDKTMNVTFDPSCDCGGRSYRLKKSLQDLLMLFNRQNPAIRKKLWHKFLDSGTKQVAKMDDHHPVP